MDHTTFINAIRADPESLTPRLIYADWLEEHGDPRGAFIRAFHAVESEDVWTDRYRAAKATLEELDKVIDPGWMARLNYDFRAWLYRPVLTKVPHDYESRLRLMEEFTSFWPPERATRKTNEKQLRKVEERIGHQLPAAYRQWLLRVKRPKSWLWFEDLRQLQIYHDRESQLCLMICRTNAGMPLFIRLDEDDPALVYHRSSDATYHEIETRLTTFLLKSMLVNPIPTRMHYQGIPDDTDEHLVAELRTAVTPCDLSGEFLSLTYEFFEAPELIGMIVSPQTGDFQTIEIYAQDTAAFDIFSPSVRHMFGVR